MNSFSSIDSVTPRLAWHRRVAPAFTLLLLAPVIAEVLSGATRMSYIFVLIPEIMVWGCAALIIREVVLRWRGGWTSMLLLGLALSVAEECIIQQTSLAPLPWPAISANYGRLWGVNWVYFLFMLGFESVWVVLVPVQVCELMFPQRRRQRWTSNVGLVISSVVFLLGSYVAWFAWTQRARVVTFHAPKYQPSMTDVVVAVIAILVLILAAFVFRNSDQSIPISSRKTPPAWAVGLFALVMGSAWYLLLSTIFSFKPSFPFWTVLVSGIAWAIFTWILIDRWSSASGWCDMQRWALVCGATCACMLMGFAGSSYWVKIDLIGKCVLNVVAVAGFVLLAVRIKRRAGSV